MNKDDWSCPWLNTKDHIEIKNTTDYFIVNGNEPTALKDEWVAKIQQSSNIAVFLADVGSLDIDKCTEILQSITEGGDNNGG